MADDEESYKDWVETFQFICRHTKRGGCAISISNSLLGTTVSVDQTDLVVINTGIEPDTLAKIYHDAFENTRITYRYIDP